MKKETSLLYSAAIAFCLFLLFSFELSAQNTPWAKRFGNSNEETISKAFTDDSSNVTIVGQFIGTVDFNPGPGVYNLTSSGYSDGYMVKLNAAGNLVSAVKFGGSDGDRVSGIIKDKIGNIYIYGDFRGTMDCDPGIGVYNITTARPLYSEHFIIKFNSFGNIIWAKNFGIKTYSGITRLQFDDSLNVYCSGVFQDSSDFDPGPGVHYLKQVTGSVFSMFLMKLTSSGNLAWAAALGGKAGYNTPRISINKTGSLYVTGYFEDTCDFDPGPGQYNMIGTGILSDIFILKLTPNGQFIWAKKIGGAGSDTGGSLLFDDSSNIFLSGLYEESVDFDPGPNTYFLHTGLITSSFILKLDSSGNFKWIKDFKGSNEVNISGFEKDSLNNFYVGGYFKSTADFDPGPGISNLSSSGDFDIFTLKLNAMGNLIWARKVGGTGYDVGGSVQFDKNGNVYTTGRFTGTADFDPGPNVFNLTSNVPNYHDVFIVKFNSLGIMPVQLIYFSGELISENKIKLDWASANEINNSHYEIERTFDPMNNNWQKIGMVKGSGTTYLKTQYYFMDDGIGQIANQGNLVYYRLKQVDFDGKFEYVGNTIIHLDETPILKTFPNPVNNTLYLSGTATIKIYDMNGALLKAEKDVSSVNVSDLTKGIYIAQITIGFQTQIVKLVKD